MVKPEQFYMDINTYQDNEDAFALLSILKLAEKDIENGNVKDSKTVFKELKESSPLRLTHD